MCEFDNAMVPLVKLLVWLTRLNASIVGLGRSMGLLVFYETAKLLNVVTLR